MFKIALTETYTAPVTVVLPGSTTKHVFDAEFKRLSQPDVESLMTRVRAGKLPDAELCREVLVGWNGVADEAGPMSFSPTTLDKLLRIYSVAGSIVNGFFASLDGAQLKN